VLNRQYRECGGGLSDKRNRSSTWTIWSLTQEVSADILMYRARANGCAFLAFWSMGTVIAAKDLLGVGIYSTAEAALYARVSPQLITRWVFGTEQGQSVIDHQLAGTDEKIVTFLDFVQSLAIRRIRQERLIPLTKIREAYNRAREQFHVDYPFAMDSTRIGLFGPPDNCQRQEIYLCIGEDDEGAQKYFQLTGKKCGNQLIGEVVRTYARRLHFDQDGIARSYTAYETPEGQIVMDPELRFGEPFIAASGYTARTLFDAYKSEGNVIRAAQIYGVDPREVELAVDYFDYLKPTCAA
jgi:uncharacterized protein (DUF433 family)